MSARKRKSRLLVAVAALSLAWPGVARADFIYSFSADTSSVLGQAGSLDFQFNGLDVGGTDTLTITAFAGGIIGTGTPTGSVIGDLAHLPVTFTDNTPFNDLSHVFTFGSSLSFTMDLATNSASPGATLTFTMFDALGNPVNAIGGGNFSAIEIDVDQGGNPESPLLGPGISGGQQGPSPTPAPPSAVLVAAGGLCLAAYRQLRRRCA